LTPRDPVSSSFTQAPASHTGDDDVLRPWLARLPARATGLLARSRRVTQVARDLAMLASSVAGPPRAVSRRHQASAAAPEGLPGELRLRVLSVRRETRDAVSLLLERPRGMTYRAGQFLTLLLSVDGAEVRRSYSLSSSPLDDGPLVVTVKRVAEGLGSGHVHASVVAGQVLRARGPSGTFVFEPGDAPAHLVLVGGGSGITPLMGILRTALSACPSLPITLVYANRSEDDVIFRDELIALAERHPALRVVHVLEEPGQALPCSAGLIGRSLLERELSAIDLTTARVYLCGPGPMMAETERALAELGLPGGQLRIERFVTVRRAPEQGERRLFKLRVGDREVAAPSDATLLESATAGRVAMDFSCTMGGCGACKVRLRQGEVTMDEPSCLSDAERDDGMVLACVARPLTDVVLERLT
jgi:ring-1,2-phenylacetyl-CoA epoxidase subunit PaaE